MVGFDGNFSREIPLLTRLINKLPNIETDVPSNFSLRGEFAYLLPGAPKGNNFNGEATSYIDDFEGTQNVIDLLAPQSWSISSRPKDLGNIYFEGDEDNNGISGLEKSLDQKLKKTKDPIKLSVDTDIQYLVREELNKFNQIFKVLGSAAILMNVNNLSLIHI